MPNHSCYYIYLAVITLAMSIYNFQISSEGKELECYRIQNMSEVEYTAFQMSFSTQANRTETTEYKALYNLNLKYAIDNLWRNTNGTHYVVAVHGSNDYQILNELIGGFYMAIVFMATLLSLFTYKMANMIPSDFIEISKFKLIAACFCKVLPVLIVVIHYLIIIFIIVIWGFLSSGSCYVSASSTPGVLKIPNYYYQQAWILSIVNTVLWFVLHLIGGVIKDSSYQEPYMYSPLVGKKGYCSYVLLKKLGP
jgi:hypothetical protein